MKNTIVKYGVLSGGIIVVIMLLGEVFFGHAPESYETGEVVGYSSMILSLLLIFLAVNEYRKQQTQQTVGFKSALLIGLMISSIAGVMVGLYNWVFVTYIAPEFMQQYFTYYIESIRNSGLPAEQISTQIAQLEQQKQLFFNPLVGFMVMFVTVFMIGLIVSVFSALIQSRLRG